MIKSEVEKIVKEYLRDELTIEVSHIPYHDDDAGFRIRVLLDNDIVAEDTHYN